MNEIPVPLTLNFVSLAIRDMAATLQFYRQLGLDIPDEADQELHVRFIFPNGMTLAWDHQSLYQQLHPEWTPPTDGPQSSFALECASPAAVDQLYAHMQTAGYGYHAPFDAPWGLRYSTLQDPDGNFVDLYAPL